MIENILGMNSQQNFLSLLEESGTKGQLTLALHILSENRELGRAIWHANGIAYSERLTPTLCEVLEHNLYPKIAELGRVQVFELRLKQTEFELRIIGELIEPPPQLLVFGAGHVGQAVAAIGAIVGYNVIVIDDRAEFLSRERFPNSAIELREENYNNIESHINISSNSAVIIVTRGHQFDETCLEQIIETPARYIGMIGSRRRVLSIFNRLTASGIRREVLDRVQAPIGLKIGAVSPQEIAVSIIAEVISTMKGGRPNEEHKRRSRS